MHLVEEAGYLEGALDPGAGSTALTSSRQPSTLSPKGDRGEREGKGRE
jgi:hypothetical protein